jgi:hypothetical protein
MSLGQGLSTAVRQPQWSRRRNVPMVTVGIDPHKHVHVAVAVDTAGRQVGKPLTVKNGPQLIAGLLTWIRSIGGNFCTQTI